LGTKTWNSWNAEIRGNIKWRPEFWKIRLTRVEKAKNRIKSSWFSRESTIYKISSWVVKF